jgi:hypothetical protein
MSAITDDHKRQWRELCGQADAVIAKLNALHESTGRAYRIRLQYTRVPTLTDDDDPPVRDDYDDDPLEEEPSDTEGDDRHRHLSDDGEDGL